MSIRISFIEGTSARFDRTRADHRTELREDYVEMIAQLIEDRGEARPVDMAAAFGVSQAAVTSMILRLCKEGLVETEPYRAVFLTTEGRRLAEACEQRHLLVVNFLQCLGVSRATAEKDAEGIEHHLSTESLKCLEKFVARAKKGRTKKDGRV